ncbi:MAG: GNAT family N-acetyltransferase [Rhodanobacteraceae bacterium]|nr:GNAT family N-acetyltransferase [Pseudomonadota bacterium]
MKKTPPHGFTITRATVADLGDLTMLFDAYRMFYHKASDPAIAREFLRERIARDESVILLARDDADRTALGFTQLYPGFSSVSARRLWILNDLFVMATARRCGVARALMESAREHAVQTGALRLVLSTAKDNAQAQALYESLGYVRDEAMYEYALELTTVAE